MEIKIEAGQDYAIHTGRTPVKGSCTAVTDTAIRIRCEDTGTDHTISRARVIALWSEHLDARVAHHYTLADRRAAVAVA